MKNNVITKLIESVASRALDREAIARLAEQYQINIGGSSIDDIDSYLYRPLTAKPMLDRSLDVIKQEQLIRVADYLFKTSPVAYRGVKLVAQYVVGSGFKIRAKDDKVAEVLQEHWDDPDNNWDINQTRVLESLLVFGEYVPRTFVNTINGHVTLGSLDPYLIKEVITDPENIAKVIGIAQKTSIDSPNTVTYRSVRIDQTGKLAKDLPLYRGKNTIGRRVGEVFYFSLNRGLSARRGYSPLLVIADWLDVYERFAFMRAENRAKLDEWIRSVKCKGFTQAQIDEFKQRFDRRPGAGKYIFHNENVEISTISPNLNAADAKEDGLLLAGLILAGLGLPIHWVFNIGETTNRASALAMGDPTVMQLMSLQSYYGYILKSILQFHLDQVRIFSSSKLNGVKPEDEGFELIAPPINVADEEKEARTLKDDTESVLVAEQQGWISKADAAKIWTNMASRRFKQEIEPESQGRESESAGLMVNMF